MTGAETREDAVRTPERTSACLDALVVLGCRPRVDPAGRLRCGVLRQRVDLAARTYAARGDEATVVVASGGRRWAGLMEADVMADELAQRGVPESALLRERRSLNTRQNAVLSIRMLGSRGRDVAVVTSDWHLPRALALFQRAGVRAEGIGATDPEGASAVARLWRRGRETLLRWVQTR